MILLAHCANEQVFTSTVRQVRFNTDVVFVYGLWSTPYHQNFVFFEIEYVCLCPTCKMAINTVVFVKYYLQVQVVISLI